MLSKCEGFRQKYEEILKKGEKLRVRVEKLREVSTGLIFEFGFNF